MKKKMIARAINLFFAALLVLSILHTMAGAEDQDNSVSNPAKIKVRFSLIDHLGQPVTERNYRGKWLLVVFGYTSCPDICPTTLYDIALTLKALDDDAKRIQALFVSVDPERDTVDVLARYIPSFGSSIVGLTGEPEKVKQAARAFRVHYEKVALSGIPGGYTMDHQSYIYLIRPDGEFETAFPHGMTVDRMVKALRRYIALTPEVHR